MIICYCPSVHQVGELKDSLLRCLQDLPGNLPYGRIEADIKTLQLAISQTNDSLYLLPASYSDQYSIILMM